MFENNAAQGYLDYAWAVLPASECQGRPAYQSAQIDAATYAHGDIIQTTSINGIEFADYTPATNDDGTPTWLSNFRRVQVSSNGKEAVSDFPSFPGTSGGLVWRVIGRRPVPFYMVTAEDPLEGLYLPGPGDENDPGFIASFQRDDETFGMLLSSLYAPPVMRSRQ